MKDLNTFTANVYAKAEAKKQQSKRTIVTAAVIACAAISAVTAAAVHPPRAAQSTNVTQAQSLSSTAQETDGAIAVEAYTAPADPTFPATARTGEAQTESRTEALPQASETGAAQPTTAPASGVTAAAINRDPQDVGVTEIAAEAGQTEIYWEDGEPTRAQTTVAAQAQHTVKEIIAAAYAALDEETRKAVDPDAAMALTLGGNADGAYQVLFPAAQKTVTVTLDGDLRPSSVKIAERPAAQVSAAYDPNAAQ